MGEKPELDKNAAIKTLGVVVAVFFALWLVASVNNDAPSPSSASTDEDHHSRLACTHFRNIANDAQLMTNAEIRAKMQEVHDDASIATPQVQAASRDALTAITSGTTAEFESAITRLSAACSAAGW